MNNEETSWDRIRKENDAITTIISWFAPKQDGAQTADENIKIPHDCTGIFEQKNAPNEPLKILLKHVDFDTPRQDRKGLSPKEDSLLALSGSLSDLFHASVEIAKLEKQAKKTGLTTTLPQTAEDIVEHAVKMAQEKGGDEETTHTIFTELTKTFMQWNNEYQKNDSGPFKEYTCAVLATAPAA